MAGDVLYTALAIVRFFGPAILILIVLSLLFRTTSKDNAKSNGYEPLPHSPIVNVTVPVTSPRRTLILTILTLSASTYLLDGTVVVLQAVLWREWSRFPQHRTWIGIEWANILGLIAFGGLVVVGTWKDAKSEDVWMGRRVKAFALVSVLYAIADTVLLFFMLQKMQPPNDPHIPENPSPPLGVTLAPFLHLGLSAFRLLVVLPFFPILRRPVTTYVPYSEAASTETAVQSSTSERTNLLGVPPTQGYGTLPSPSTAPSIHSSSGELLQTKPSKPSQDKDVPEPSWRETLGKVRRLVPYLWPSNSPRLQLLAGACFLILIAGRVINVLLPLTLRQLVDEFDQGTSGIMPMALILTYCGLRFMQGSGGLNALRDLLWAPVMQYSDREMSQLCFDHLLNLSLAFHTNRKTGEIMRILDRGAAINRMFELLLFSVVPTFLDIVVAAGAFFYFFGWELCVVICVVMVTYVVTSVLLTRWRTKLRRAMIERDVITRGIHTDSLLNYDTIKYFVGEEHEGARYRDAISRYQVLEYKVIASLNLLNFLQNFIISLGLLTGSLIIAWRIVHSTSRSSDFVFFITYLAQLYGPLNLLGSLYRSINQSMVDAEKLLGLLNQPTEVNDKPGAQDLVVKDGVITFEDVSFSYDNKTTALHNVNFTVAKGQSLALVGESGGGKSTILRLLFRQYDLKEGEGRILIDGQDIRDVTQKSLRRAIGVVPQDSVLFNASIGYNIGYGKFDATQEEIEHAAKAAQLHERVLGFPDGYDTRVGERGVRLSGGEKQRVAIARTFLKNSSILALDEATSALDTATEKDIQKALQNLLHGRSSISIAHRLSTIASSDVIVVLKDGHIVESGSHEELLAKDGEFAAMWAKQVTKDDQGHEFFSSAEAASEGYHVKDIAAPVPQVIPEPPANGAPFLMPGPALVPLPPTEAELKAESDGHIRHDTEATVRGDGPSPDTQDEIAEMLAAAEAARAARGIEQATVVTEVPAEEPATYAEIVSEEPTEEAQPAPAPVQEVEVPPVVAFPLSPPQISPPPIPASPGAVAFPSNASDTSSQRQASSVAPTPSISFVPLDPPSARPGAPAQDKEEKEPKRKRISSQNFQRLARRISLGSRKGSSSSIPAQVSPEPSSGSGVASREASIDSPPASKLSFFGSSSKTAAPPPNPTPKGTTTPTGSNLKNTATPPPAIAASSAVMSPTSEGSPSETESISTSTPKAKRKQLQKKKPTRSKTTF